MSIKLFVMDVDGTMTDGKIYIGNSGEAFKSFDVKDGYGIWKGVFGDSYIGEWKNSKADGY